MTLRRDATTGNYSADIRSRSSGRIHVTLNTQRKAEALQRYAALVQFVREGDAALIALLRDRRVTIEAIARLHRDHRPFKEMLGAKVWPALADAAQRYEQWLAQRHRPANTIANAHYGLADAITFFGAAAPMAALTEEKVAEFRHALAARGLAGNTMRRKLLSLSGLFSWLQDVESRTARRARRPAETLYNPVDRQLLPAEGPARKRFLSHEEVQQLMAATPVYYQLAVALGILAGLRYDEMRTLERADIDVEHGVVSVREKLLTPDLLWRPKSRSSRREVPLCAALRPLAERHLRQFAGERWLYQSSVTSEPWEYDYIAKAFKRIAGDADLVSGRADPAGVTFHTLRHTFASHLVMAGVDLFTVARLMGHANTREVETVYGHLSPHHRTRAVELLGDALAKAFGPRLVTEGEA